MVLGVEKRVRSTYGNMIADGVKSGVGWIWPLVVVFGLVLLGVVVGVNGRAGDRLELRVRAMEERLGDIESSRGTTAFEQRLEAQERGLELVRLNQRLGAASEASRLLRVVCQTLPAGDPQRARLEQAAAVLGGMAATNATGGAP